jgi:hypothetical protein
MTAQQGFRALTRASFCMHGRVGPPASLRRREPARRAVPSPPAELLEKGLDARPELPGVPATIVGVDREERPCVVEGATSGSFQRPITYDP